MLDIEKRDFDDPDVHFGWSSLESNLIGDWEDRLCGSDSDGD